MKKIKLILLSLLVVALSLIIEIAVSGIIAAIVASDVITNTISYFGIIIGWILMIPIFIKIKVKEMLPRKKVSFNQWIYIVFGAIFINLAVTSLGRMITKSLVDESELAFIMETTKLVFVNGYILTFVTAVIIAPVFEEILCRGYVYGKLEQAFKPKTVIILSAIFFALMHLNPVLIFFTFFLGVVLGYIRKYTNSIMAVIVFHMVNNFMTDINNLYLYYLPVLVLFLLALFSSLMTVLMIKKLKYISIPPKYSKEIISNDQETDEFNETGVIRCRVCNKEMYDEQRFCGNCGNPR